MLFEQAPDPLLEFTSPKLDPSIAVELDNPGSDRTE